MKIATYNIQFSAHPTQIIENIQTMADDGVQIFCLQEVVSLPHQPFIISQLLQHLGKDWKAICHLGNEKTLLGMGSCILWNSSVFHLEKVQKVLLPKSQKLSGPEKAFSWLAGGITVPFQRRAIIGYFTVNKKMIRISNVHLDHNGGVKNRKKQLLSLMEFLAKDEVAHEIICGDFNSFDLLNNDSEAKMHLEVLGEKYHDISKDSGWTGDLHDMDIENGGRILKFLIQKLNIHLRRKVDYIWVKNISSINCEAPDLAGSDHRPVVAEIKV